MQEREPNQGWNYIEQQSIHRENNSSHHERAFQGRQYSKLCAGEFVIAMGCMNMNNGGHRVTLLSHQAKVQD
jgi:hypothetical protein